MTPYGLKQVGITHLCTCLVPIDFWDYKCKRGIKLFLKLTRSIVYISLWSPWAKEMGDPQVRGAVNEGAGAVAGPPHSCVLGSEAPGQPCPVLPAPQCQGRQRSGVSWLGSWRAVRCPAFVHRRWVMGGRPAAGGRPQQWTETLSGSPCTCWDPCTGARRSRLQSSNHTRLWEVPHWVWASLTCVLSALTDPAHLWLWLSVVVIVMRFRFPQFLLFTAEGLKPTFYQGQTEVTPSLCW